MIFIAHRGNVNGIDRDKENRLDYIYEALNKGFDVEIDAWYSDKQWWLGHDEPTYKTGTSIFNNKKVWVHVKNPEGLKEIQYVPCHYFWHDGDDYTLTSKGIIWCHRDAIILPDSICVLPEFDEVNVDEVPLKGICSDFIQDYKIRHEALYA